jgi:hypothetical protein
MVALLAVVRSGGSLGTGFARALSLGSAMRLSSRNAHAQAH